MKTKYIAAIAMLALLSFSKPAIALEPGEMRVRQDVGYNGTENLTVWYDFGFELAEGSDGVYPAAEMVEIEVPGELSPDGSQSPAFVISIPVGSFQEGPTGFFYAWNPPGLKVSQHDNSNVWDFVDPDGVRRDSEGVLRFWAFIHVRDPGQLVNLVISMAMTDNRNHDATIGPAPNIVELLVGGPTLRIGNDEWEAPPVRFGRLLSH